MTKELFVFFSGILLTVIPFLGIPESWRQYGVFALGCLLVLVGYALRRASFFKRIEREGGERAADTFVESTKPLFDEDALQ